MNLSYINSDDPRITKTIKSIYDAFFACLDEVPYSKINVKMICEKANINRSTFYMYYEDKQHLLECILADIVNNVGSSAMEPSLEAVDESIPTQALGVWTDYRKLLYEVFYGPEDKKMVPLFHQIIANDLTESIAIYLGGQKLSSKRIEFIVRFYTGAVSSVLSWWVANESSVPFEYMVEKFRIMLRPMFENCKLALKEERTESAADAVN